MVNAINKDSMELFTSQLTVMETADLVNSTASRAIIKMRIINEGANSKNLIWTPETMEKIVTKFRGVPFRYDLNGENEGSHTRDKISSPYYDVGWTYSGANGAWYDQANKCIWVEGEVTHPEVINKLSRQTSDGKREINYGSMGAVINTEDTKCSICGTTPFGTCGHERGKEYNGKVCGMIPLDITKALHVALTNDPADKMADIESAIFQDMISNGADSPRQQASLPVGPNMPTTPGVSELRDMMKSVINELLASKGAGAKSSEEDTMKEEKKKKVVTAEADEAKEEKAEEKKEPKKEEKTKEEKAEEKKEVPMKKEETAENSEDAVPEKESKEDDDEDDDEKKKKKAKKELAEDKVAEAKKPDVEAEASAGNTGLLAKEGTDVKAGDDKTYKVGKTDGVNHTMADIMPKGGIATADAGLDNSSFKITGPAMGVSKVEAPITQHIETADASKTSAVDYAAKYKGKLIAELADSFVRLGKANTKNDAVNKLQNKSIQELEVFQDAFDGIIQSTPAIPQEDNNSSVNSEFADTVPEYGGTSVSGEPYTEVADMTPEDRRKTFGEYGSWDVLFNSQHASKYRKKTA